MPRVDAGTNLPSLQKPTQGSDAPSSGKLLHGYQAASLPHLLDGMGLTQGSLCKVFHDKKSLFLQILDRYETAAVDAGVTLPEDQSAGDARARILAIFSGLVAAVEGGDYRGCLLCTAASGATSDDTALADTPGIAAAGRLRLAGTLLTQYIGLRMLARSRLPLGILEQRVRGVADIVDGAAR